MRNLLMLNHTYMSEGLIMIWHNMHETPIENKYILVNRITEQPSMKVFVAFYIRGYWNLLKNGYHKAKDTDSWAYIELPKE